MRPSGAVAGTESGASFSTAVAIVGVINGVGLAVVMEDEDVVCGARGVLLGVGVRTAVSMVVGTGVEATRAISVSLSVDTAVLSAGWSASICWTRSRQEESVLARIVKSASAASV